MIHNGTNMGKRQAHDAHLSKDQIANRIDFATSSTFAGVCCRICWRYCAVPLLLTARLDRDRQGKANK